MGRDGAGRDPAAGRAAAGGTRGSTRYDAALLDLIGDAAQLGLLRAQGLVTGGTLVLAGFADHRVRSERELARRCAFWGATPVRDGDVWTVPATGARHGRWHSCGHWDSRGG